LINAEYIKERKSRKINSGDPAFKKSIIRLLPFTIIFGVGAVVGFIEGVWPVALFCLVLTLLFVSPLVRGEDMIWEDVIVETRFNCRLCGYQWSHLPGEPYPEIHVRPDLIALGQRRLQDEEKQRFMSQGAWEYYFKPKK
jgi:hypothetical protein